MNFINFHLRNLRYSHNNVPRNVSIHWNVPAELPTYRFFHTDRSRTIHPNLSLYRECIVPNIYDMSLTVTTLCVLITQPLSSVCLGALQNEREMDRAPHTRFTHNLSRNML